jgi:hypothetical protein
MTGNRHQPGTAKKQGVESTDEIPAIQELADERGTDITGRAGD